MTTTIDVGIADSFRPTTWADYVGQNSLKTRLETHITSALVRDKRLGHVLLVASPGYGKTTIARMISTQMIKTFLGFTMPIEDAILDSIVTQFHGIVFFDELHSASDKFQERLLPLIEDGYLQAANGRRIVNHDLTIVAATTERKKILPPLYQRFEIKPTFDEYTTDEMAQILTGMATRIGLPEDEVWTELAEASAATPRQAKELVIMARDLYAATGYLPSAAEVLASCRVSADGLTEDHTRYLTVLNQLGGAAGVKLIGNHLRLEESVLLELERLLVRHGLITYSKRGRELTPIGWQRTGTKLGT